MVNDFVQEALKQIALAVASNQGASAKLNEYVQMSFGDLSKLDVRKWNLHPVVHVNVGNATLTGVGYNVMQLDLEIMCFKVIDIDREMDLRMTDNLNFFQGAEATNIVPALNDCLYIMNNIIAVFSRGSAFTSKVQIVDGDVSLQPFVEYLENNLAGWATTITIQMPNTNMRVCSNGY